MVQQKISFVIETNDYDDTLCSAKCAALKATDAQKCGTWVVYYRCIWSGPLTCAEVTKSTTKVYRHDDCLKKTGYYDER